MKRSTHLAQLFAKWLDQSYLDPLIGLLLPEVGDLASTAAGLVVVVTAWREGVPTPVLARMVANLAIDGIVGAVPIVGDAFDFMFKAHTRNAALLQAREVAPAHAKDYALLVGSLAALVVAIALPIVALVGIIAWLLRAFNG